jgi:hypothetical protein
MAFCFQVGYFCGVRFRIDSRCFCAGKHGHIKDITEVIGLAGDQCAFFVDDAGDIVRQAAGGRGEVDFLLDDGYPGRGVTAPRPCGGFRAAGRPADDEDVIVLWNVSTSGDEVFN